jgi:pseudouridine synthase
MYGRMMHSLEGELTYQQYGKEGQAIFSVSRGKINATMMDIAETHGNAKIHYQTECLRVDLKNAVAYLRNTETGQEIEAKSADEEVLIAFNKPIGIVCTTEQGARDNIIDYLKFGQRIFPIGRLDKESQGLIFLTSNGDIVNKILRAGNKHEKEYLVTVNKPITDAFIEGMGHGVPVLGVNTRKCFIQKESTNVFRIILIHSMLIVGFQLFLQPLCRYISR